MMEEEEEERRKRPENGHIFDRRGTFDGDVTRSSIHHHNNKREISFEKERTHHFLPRLEGKLGKTR